MRPSSVIAALTTCATAVLAALAGVAHADPTAQETIAQLKDEGYTVNVDRVGNAPVDDCVVTSVRNPQIQTRYVRDYYGKRDENGKRRYRLVEVVVSRSISVSLTCSP